MSVTDNQLKRILEAAEEGISCQKAEYDLPGDAALDKCRKNGWIEFRECPVLYDEKSGKEIIPAAPVGFIVLTEAGKRELARLRSL